MEEENKPLYVAPSKRRWKAITTYCYACKRNVSEICKETGRPLKFCQHGDRHVFKLYLGIPGTDERKTKALGRDYEIAVKTAMEIERKIKQGDNIEENQQQIGKNEGSKPSLLKDAMARYVGYLNNDPEIVPEFRRVEFSYKHISDVKRSFKYFMICGQQNGYDINALGVNDMNDQMLDKFHKHLLQDLKLSNRSYNKILTIFTTFYNHLINENCVSKNPFKTIPRKEVFSNVETIHEEELKQLLEIIQKEELGKHELANGSAKSFFKPWMKDAVELGLYTGRRNEEIVQMKWKNVELENGNMSCIKIQDFKVNRQKGNEAGNLKFIYVPITYQLHDVLMRIGYEKYKGSDKYILAPEETMQRDTINGFMTRSFSHYYQKLSTGKNLSYKCLRKTYISQLVKFMGLDNARIITRHSGTEVMEKHYIDKKYIALTAQGFKMFDRQNGARQNEIEGIRISKPVKQTTIER